ncbi:MAG TPA: MotA/TolQ/ExbB proton channel family protein [Bacteroidales bacterium]|nr:MotA/TolQ/ExbB proton channel family protein [Bacteroidales bacterium]
MKEIFFMGGPLFMSILTLLFIGMVAWAIYQALPVLRNEELIFGKIKMRLKHIRSIGLFAMITGILGQLIGLYEAFSAIERAGDISPGLVYSGLKVSMITTLYGIFIYLISLILWFVLDYLLSKKMTSN